MQTFRVRFSLYNIWIGTNHGLRCPKYGSVLYATIHGLSMDRANEGLKVWISAKPVMDALTLAKSGGLCITKPLMFATEAPPAAMLVNEIHEMNNNIMVV